MKYTNEFMLMIAKFLYGEYDALKFSYDFPDNLSAVYDAFHTENAALCDFLEEEMPEVCAWFDPYQTGDPGTLDEAAFRKKVMEIYRQALAISLNQSQKVS